MVVALIALIAAGSGLALAATTSSPVIHACAKKKSGALRLAAKCHHGERAVSWNQIGPQGLPGAAGPRGPGASSFSTSVPADSTYHTLANVNGLAIQALCNGGTLNHLAIVTTPDTSTLQASGTYGIYGLSPSVGAVDVNGVDSYSNSSGEPHVNLDVIVRNTAVASNFVRVDVHVEGGGTNQPCPAWGMITPSS